MRADLEGLAGGSWDDRFTIAGVTGTDGFTPAVHDLVAGPDGTTVVAGYYLFAGRERVGPLAALDGADLTALRGDLASFDAFDVSTAAVSGDRLALSTFLPLLPVVPPVPQGGEILVDVGDGTLTSIGSFAGVVRTLAWLGDELWVGGHFALDGHEASELAVWSDGAWHAAPGGAVDGPVYTLTVEGDTILVGGSFTGIGGVAARSVAAWNDTTWTAYDVDLGPGPDGAFQGPVVYGLARGDDATLYAGGIFFPDDTPTEGGVARWTGSAWEVLGQGLAQAGGFFGDYGAVVADVAFFEGHLYAAGCFSRRGEDAAGARTLPGIARWSGSAWEVPTGTNAGVVGDFWYQSGVCGGEPSGTAILEAPFQALRVDGARLLVGGQFAGLGGVPSKSLVAYDGEGWIRLGDTAGLGLAGAPSALAVGGEGCDVYAFGGVTHAGSAAGAVIYRFDGSAWHGVADALPPEVDCTTIAVGHDGALYLGCGTRWVDETPPAPRVFRRDGDAWTALGEITGATGDFLLGALAIDRDGDLWAVGGAEQGFVARWHDGAWQRVGEGLDGGVMAIAFGPEHRADHPQVAIGGGFAHVGALTVNGVARWDGAAWSALGAGFTVPQTPVWALAWNDDGLYASGASSGQEEFPHAILARWDGGTWTELGTVANGLPAPREGTVHQFRVLRAVGDAIVAAGGIYPESGGRNVFVFDDGHFVAIGDGVGAGAVDTLAVTPDALWFGGTIATTGRGATLAPSIGVARYGLAP